MSVYGVMHGDFTFLPSVSAESCSHTTLPGTCQFRPSRRLNSKNRRAFVSSGPHAFPRHYRWTGKDCRPASDPYSFSAVLPLKSVTGGTEAVPFKKDGVPYRILVSTGDVMGDIHAAEVVKSLYDVASESGIDLQIVALGGKRVQAAGAELLGEANTRLSSIGLWEALSFVLPALRLQAKAEKYLLANPPDGVVLIDYPGVNIPFGRWLKNRFGCFICFYIPPNEWLLTPARTPAIVDLAHSILSVYPREAEHYAAAGGSVKRVSHPLLDFVKTVPSQKEAREEVGVPSSALVVALLPASRTQELRMVWPLIAKAARGVRERLTAAGGGRCEGGAEVHFVIPVALEGQVSVLQRGLEEEGLAECSTLWMGSSHAAMACADVAITKSGSATVELALIGVPQVAVYRVSAVSAWIARNVLGFRPPYVSLVNLILEENLVPEFIQEAADADAIATATVRALAEREAMLRGYERLKALLGKPGASRETALHVLTSMGAIDGG